MPTKTRPAKRQKKSLTEDTESLEEEDERNVPPTEEEISLALCRINDTEKNSAKEIIKSLDDLTTWADTDYNNNDEIVRISKEFIELGGIPRILNFVKGNKNNNKFMQRASKVINMFLYSGDEDQHLENTSKMAQKFVDRGGVEIMLSIINENCTGKLNTDQLNTLGNIFGVFNCTIYNLNEKNMVDIDTFIPIIDAGISTMAILSKISTHGAVISPIKEEIFTLFMHFVKFYAEMIDITDFHEKNIFQECINSLKNLIDSSWKYDKDVWKNASLFFYVCCNRKENRKILSREGDFEVIIPFLIQFIKVDPDNAYTTWVFDLLRKAIDAIGKKKMITSTKGLLEVLGTVADCSNDNVSNDTREEAIYLMEYLFDKS